MNAFGGGETRQSREHIFGMYNCIALITFKLVIREGESDSLPLRCTQLHRFLVVCICLSVCRFVKGNNICQTFAAVLFLEKNPIENRDEC